jgi:acyl-CoA synthetase (AMP-forming)/AMP-acid ligase II
MKDFSSIRDILEFRKGKNPDKEAVIFLADGEEKEERLTFSSLYEEALRYAAGLQARGIEKGDRVIIMLPTELDFLSFLYGTLLIGAVPVPAYPPFSLAKIEHYLETFSGILANSGARVLITFSRAKKILGSVLHKAPHLDEVLEAGEIEGEDSPIKAAKIGLDDIALIQYTSGSTSAPKGVMLTYQNILTNVRNIGEVVRSVPEEEIVSTWLPPYHDMGLIASIFYSAYWGFTLCLMSPLHFLVKPVRWLRAISRYRCTQSAAPNFAYELCTRKIQESDLAGLDLSCWKVACNGAEPIRKATQEAFIERFGCCGFDRKTMYPVYGLAEHTVAVTFPKTRRGPCYLFVDRSSLEPGKHVKLNGKGDEKEDYVSVGSPFPEHEIRIVDEEGHTLPELVVGEIAVGGPSLSPGYYSAKEAFESQLLAGRESTGPLFRTGDLGFCHRGELYVTGRKKDLIIIRGSNYYPQDIEAIVDGCRYARRGCSAAFSVEGEDGTESLVIVAETKARSDGERRKLEKEIKRRVVDIFGIRVKEVVLLPPRTIPKTSSGKIQRRKCRALFLEGDLPTSGKLPLCKKAAILIRSALGYLVFFARNHLRHR